MPRPVYDTKRLGTILLMGAIAGLGASYVASRRRPEHSTDSRLIDWDLVRRTSLNVSQNDQAPVRNRAVARERYSDMVRRSEPLIAEYLGVHLPEPIKRVYVVDRREWLEANFDSFAGGLRVVEELYQRGAARASARRCGRINGRIIGAQMGVLLGLLARGARPVRSSLLSPDPEVRGALYFVEPNIARVQTQLGLSDEDFRLWIALHEVTHVFEFEAYPWVREYFNGLLRQFMDQLTDQLSALGVGLPQLLGRLVGPEASGQHWIEAHADARAAADLQSAPGADVAGRGLFEPYHERDRRPAAAELPRRSRSASSSAKGNRPLVEEIFNRITGMDLKLAQYKQGEAFVERGAAARRRVSTASGSGPSTCRPWPRSAIPSAGSRVWHKPDD